MTTTSGTPSAGLTRWSGIALILGGVSFALFLLLHPYNQLAGAAAAEQPTWVPAHTFHFVGALLTLPGLVGLYLAVREETGRVGLVGFLLAFAGTTMFAGTGMITAFIWPVIARSDPSFVDVDGPMFVDPMAFGTISGTYAVLILGWVIFGIALLRAAAMPRGAALATMVGVVLFGVPVEPVGPAPWIVRVLGAIVFGAGLAWLGWTLWRAETPVL